MSLKSHEKDITGGTVQHVVTLCGELRGIIFFERNFHKKGQQALQKKDNCIYNGIYLNLKYIDSVA